MLPSLQVATEAVAFGLVIALAASVAIQLLSGGINLRGLMRAKTPGGELGVSPARAQMLLVTLGVAGAWLGLVVGGSDTGRLPEVPAAWVAALGASHAGYLVSKVRQFIPVRDVIRSFLGQEKP